MSAFRLDLPRSPDSVSAARRHVDAYATGLGPQRRDDAALMVSELVTNALQHGTGKISLRIDLEPDAVRIEVSDDGDVAVASSPAAGAHGGWGLRIVEHLADEWGVEAGSTKVWFRLGRSSATH